MRAATEGTSATRGYVPASSAAASHAAAAGPAPSPPAWGQSSKLVGDGAPEEPSGAVRTVVGRGSGRNRAFRAAVRASCSSGASAAHHAGSSAANASATPGDSSGVASGVGAGVASTAATGAGGATGWGNSSSCWVRSHAITRNRPRTTAKKVPKPAPGVGGSSSGRS